MSAYLCTIGLRLFPPTAALTVACAPGNSCRDPTGLCFLSETHTSGACCSRAREKKLHGCKAAKPVHLLSHAALCSSADCQGMLWTEPLCCSCRSAESTLGGIPKAQGKAACKGEDGLLQRAPLHQHSRPHWRAPCSTCPCGQPGHPGQPGLPCCAPTRHERAQPGGQRQPAIRLRHHHQHREPGARVRSAAGHAGQPGLLPSSCPETPAHPAAQAGAHPHQEKDLREPLCRHEQP